MTLREIIEVLQAAERGEAIQALDAFNPSSGWFDVDPPLGPPLWNFSRYALRIKPREPQTIYLVRVYGTLCNDECYTEREAAARAISDSDARSGAAQVVEFREVLP